MSYLITRKSLQDRAGTITFRRGEEYFANEAVSRLRAVEEKVSARVEGSDTYQVELWDDDGDLDYECSCPQGDDGNFLQALRRSRPGLACRETIEGKSGGASGKRIYRDVLGAAGLQRLRELAEAEWRKTKPIANQPGDGRSYDSSRWRITHIMETLAELSGDIEQLVAIKQRDLSSGYHYLAIAEVYEGRISSNCWMRWPWPMRRDQSAEAPPCPHSNG